ncbi:hypothetical protein COCNU_scaffold040622G000010 [Cocos nucifera]|nr:hypothetical protein [Cocos nucifera]
MRRKRGWLVHRRNPISAISDLREIFALTPVAFSLWGASHIGEGHGHIYGKYHGAPVHHTTQSSGPPNYDVATSDSTEPSVDRSFNGDGGRPCC